MHLSLREVTRNIHRESLNPIGVKEARALARKLIKVSTERRTSPIKTRTHLRAIIRGSSAHPLTNVFSYQTYHQQQDSIAGNPVSFYAWSYGSRVINDDLASRRPAKDRWVTLKVKKLRPGSLIVRAHDHQKVLRVDAILSNAMLKATCPETNVTMVLSPEHAVLLK